MTFLQNELLTKNEIIKSLNKTQTNIKNLTNSIRVINLLTYQKQHQFSQHTPTQQQKQINHPNQMNTLQSSEKGICHDQKTKQIQNEHYILKQKS